MDIPVFIPPKPNVKIKIQKCKYRERITIDLDLEIDKNPLSLPPPTADRNKQSNKLLRLFEQLTVDESSFAFLNKIP